MKQPNKLFLHLHKWSTEFSVEDRTGHGIRWGARLFRIAFKDAGVGGYEGKLPKVEQTIVRSVFTNCGAGITLMLRPKPPEGYGLCRVFVMCERCQRNISAGRIAQHRC